MRHPQFPIGRFEWILADNSGDGYIFRIHYFLNNSEYSCLAKEGPRIELILAIACGFSIHCSTAPILTNYFRLI